MALRCGLTIGHFGTPLSVGAFDDSMLDLPSAFACFRRWLVVGVVTGKLTESSALCVCHAETPPTQPPEGAGGGGGGLAGWLHDKLNSP